MRSHTYKKIIFLFLCLFAFSLNGCTQLSEFLASSQTNNSEVETSSKKSSKVRSSTEPSTEVSAETSEENTHNESPVEIAAEELTQLHDNLPVLKRGDKGDDVKDLQIKLQNAGFYAGDIDGLFGPMTEASVKKIQEAYKYCPGWYSSR